MGAWGPGPLENDAAWDALTRLAGTSTQARASVVLATLGRDVPWDVDDASEVVVAALLVAMARDPAHFTGDRVRVVAHVSRTAEVRTFADLVGDRKALRTPAVARAALAALSTVRETSELASLWADDEAWAAGFDELAAAVAAPTAPWPASADRPRRLTPIRTSFAPGTLVGVELGDGRRGYAVYRGEFWMTVYDVVDVVTRPAQSASAVLAATVAFQMKVNEFDALPPGWSACGVVDESLLPELPMTFHQSTGSHRRPELFPPRGRPRVARQEDCVGLEPYGIAWRPETLADRLRHVLAGQPHPETAAHAVRLSRSLFRVVTRREADAAARNGHLAPGGDANAEHAYASLPVALQLARTLGPGRDDLVLVEIDAAALEVSSSREAPVDERDPEAPVVTWARLVGGFAVDVVHEIRATEDGYEPVEPVVPRYP